MMLSLGLSGIHIVGLRIIPLTVRVLWLYFGPTVEVILQSGQFFLIHVPTPSASVERSFSLAGNMDTKYGHGLPNNTRRLTTMLMFNGDVEGRFKVA